MALPLPQGLTQFEVGFLAEMELVTIVPRQRLDSVPLLAGQTPLLRPPARSTVPLWLALLLKKQRRANIVPPPWLHPASLTELINAETYKLPNEFTPPPPPPSHAHPSRPGQARRFSPDDSLSAPFLPSCTADAPAEYLPYHWLEVAELLMVHAGDDMPAAVGEVRSLVKELEGVRQGKLRRSMASLDTFGGGLTSLKGVGAMELAEHRGFVVGVIDGVRKLGASKEATRREEEEDAAGDEDSDDDMGF